MQVLIRKAQIVDPQSAHHNKVTDLLIEDGVITRLAAGIRATADTVIDIPGLHVSPGWVDTLADYAEPGYEHRETIASGLAAAAAGGFTDVLLAPNTQPALSGQSAVQYVQQRAAGNAVSLRPIGAATRDVAGKELAEMLDMRTHGAIAFSDGWNPIQNSVLMMKALEYVSAFCGVVIQIPVDTALSAGGLMNEGPVSVSLGLAGVPHLAETLMVYRDTELARYTGSRLHISGISCAGSVDIIRRAKAEGVRVTCSVTPYHLALTDEVFRTYNSVYKVAPPLRAEADRQALIAALLDGTIDCIATHHRPHEWDAKTKELEYAATGMAIQQSAFPVIWNTLSSLLSPERLVQLFSVLPRDIFGLPQGTIAKGAAASLTLFVPEATTTLTKAQAKSAGINNPFIGQPLAGRIAGIVNNNKVYLNN